MEWRVEQLIKRSSTMEAWLSRIAALGVCTGWGTKRKAPFLAAFEVGRRTAVSKLQMWRTKGRFSPTPSRYLFLNTDETDDEVSSWSPIDFDSLYFLVRFIFQIYKVRYLLLCIKQLSGVLLPSCTWETFRSISILYKWICAYQNNQYVCSSRILNNIIR